jgi:hypothetical protein
MRSSFALIIVLAVVAGCATPTPSDRADTAGGVLLSSPASAQTAIEFNMGTMVGYSAPLWGPGAVGSFGTPEIMEIPLEEPTSASVTAHWNATTPAAARFMLVLYEGDNEGRSISDISGTSPLVLDVPAPIASQYRVGLYAAEGSVTVDQKAMIVISATR